MPVAIAAAAAAWEMRRTIGSGPEERSPPLLATAVPQLVIDEPARDRDVEQREAGEQVDPAAGHAEIVAAMDPLGDLGNVPAERLAGIRIARLGKTRGSAGLCV